MEYTNFLLKLSKRPPGQATRPPAPLYQAQVLYPATATGGPFDLALTVDDIAWLRELAADLRDFARVGAAHWRGLGYRSMDTILRAVTGKLQASLPEEVRGALRGLMAEATGQGRGVRVGLLIDPGAAELATLPWELLWDPAGGEHYLAQSAHSPLVRLVATPVPPPRWRAGDHTAIRTNSGDRLALGVPALPGGALRVLVVVPGGCPGTCVAGAAAEVARIRAAVAGVPGAEVTVLGPPATLAATAAALAGAPYQVVHFLAHGDVDAGLDLAYLALDSAPGGNGAVPGVDPVVATRLRPLIGDQPALQLVVFAVCRSADPVVAGEAPTVPLPAADPAVPGGPPALAPASLGPQIAATTGTAVLAMQFDMPAPAVSSWAGAFYRQLGAGSGVEPALAAARRALLLTEDPVSWAGPTLYLPLYRPARPPSLYSRIDRSVYSAVAALMEADGQPLLEGLLLAGLALGTWLLMQGLFSLPAAAGDRPALLRTAAGLILTTSVLPLLLAGGALLLEVRRQPRLRAFGPAAAGTLALMAYAGAGLGILAALAPLALLALLLYYLAVPAALTAPVLSILAVLGALAVGLVFAARFLRAYESVTPQPRLARADVLPALGAPLTGVLFALLLLTSYDLVLERGVGVAILAVAFVGVAAWSLRRARRPPG